MYGSECWATKKKDERKLHTAEMRILRWKFEVTRMDKVRNEFLRESLVVTPITEKFKGNQSFELDIIMMRREEYETRRVMNMNVVGWRGRG
jgi:hypothetical protein